MNIDWAAVWGSFAAFAVSAMGIAASYGALRQKVANQDARMSAQDQRLDKLAEAIDKATSVATEVALLRQSSEASHRLLLTKQEASQELTSTKFDSLTGEVRAFMQGQAAGGARPAGRPKPA